jgi:photosystem II stability/assembly factor-like uncharacterized protein
MGCVVFDPMDQNHQTLYAGTANVSSGGRDGGRPGLLYKTTDGGQNWTPIGAGLAGWNILDIVPTGLVDRPTKLQIILAGVTSSTGNSGGVFRSTDGGNNFVRVLGGATTSLVADPRDRNTFYVAGPSGVAISTGKTSATFAITPTYVGVRPVKVTLTATLGREQLRAAINIRGG